MAFAYDLRDVAAARDHDQQKTFIDTVETLNPIYFGAAILVAAQNLVKQKILLAESQDFI
jgi:hypothetical protein